jgi:hypothetical protein
VLLYLYSNTTTVEEPLPSTNLMMDEIDLMMDEIDWMVNVRGATTKYQLDDSF